MGLPPPLLWRAGRGLLSFPCLGYVWAALRVVWVGAPRVGAFGWFPFTCGWAVISVLRAARERAPPGVWLPGVVALVAYAVSGNPVTVSVGRGCGVSLCSSAVLFAWAACVLVCARLALRAVACACCAPCLCVCCRAPCFGWGVLLRSSRCARSAVCLSVAACGGARCWFVTVCVACRLLWWCVIRECSRSYCDMVHAGWCGCTFDGDLGCRLLFTV